MREGDKRIILVDGEYAGAVNRVPAADDLRSNMVRGGSPKETELTPREREICSRLGPHLRERGLLLVGIDVIGGWLTEINVTSPTGIRAVKNVGGPDIAKLVWDTIEAKRKGLTAATSALQGLAIPRAAISRSLVGALHEVEQRIVRRRRRAHRVVVEQKLPDILVIGRASWANRLGAETVRLRIRIGIERRAAVAAIARPGADARAFVAVGLVHHPGGDVRRVI